MGIFTFKIIFIEKNMDKAVTESTALNSISFFNRAKGDLVYALLLLCSALFSALLRNFASAGQRRRVDGLIGLGIAAIVGGWMCFCSLIIVLTHLLLFHFVKCPKFLANVSFFGTFTYLAVLRFQHFFGFPRLEFVTNAIQLIITLRVIGLSYEIADMRTESGGRTQRNSIKKIEPSMFDTFNYLYSFTGLFTGPYYTFKTYSDALHVAGVVAPPLLWCKIRPLIGEKLQALCWSFPCLILTTWLNPIEAIRGPRIDSYNLLQLFIWSALAFVHMRMRVYSAWMIAESVCIISGIGVYPSIGQNEAGRGPAEDTIWKLNWSDPKVELDAETIKNLDIPSVEYSDGFRSGIRSWNKTVQFWLATFVYRRTDRRYRLPYTMFISAFWHGIHPGYFLSFLTVPLCTAAEDRLFRTFPKRATWLKHLWICVRSRGFDMMACGFLLLDGWDTIRLWSKMYFWLHLAMIGTIVLCSLKKETTIKGQKID